MVGLPRVAVGGLARLPAPVQIVGGLLLSLCYGVWAVYGMSFGYVAHDHMAIMVAMLVLPTAATCRYADRGGSERAGWALRWANSGTLAWAVLRRPTVFNVHLVERAQLLRAAQWEWGSIGLELSAPLIFVREHVRWLVVAVFMGFHVSTLLGIHFLPTAISWSAFLPGERLRTARRRA